MSTRPLFLLPLLPLLLPAAAFAQEPAPASPPPGPPPVAPPFVPLPLVEPPPSVVSPSAGPPAEAPASADRSPFAKDGYPMAGWHNGLFYLRDANDNFRLHVQGRGQIDFYGYAGPGVSDSGTKGAGQVLTPTLFLRRVRPEITGEVLQDWSFMLAGDFGATGLDNTTGASSETRAAAPGAAPTAASGAYAGAQTAKISAAATDVFLNYHAHPLLNVQVGQFDAPFTMENRTSDKYFPFIERSLAVRAVGIPTNKEIGAMAWGETENRLFYYSVGLFDGDGQNKLNTDGRGDVMLRTFVHPLASAVDDPILKNVQIGGSLRYGSRDSHLTNYDYAAMTTQANFTFWKPTYSGSNGTVHVLPSGEQLGVAGELRIPVSMFDLTGELVYIGNGTRESLEGYQATNTERFGSMKGTSYYVQLGFWPLGGRDLNGQPGYENIPHVDFKKTDPETPKQALQLLAKWEQVALTYASASRDGQVDPKGIDGDIKVNAFSLGANYWATKHIRLSANYVLDMFPDSAPTSASAAGGPVQTSTNRAIAPGNALAKGVNDGARDSAHVLHELVMRFAVAL